MLLATLPRLWLKDAGLGLGLEGYWRVGTKQCVHVNALLYSEHASVPVLSLILTLVQDAAVVVGSAYWLMLPACQPRIILSVLCF